MCPPARAARRSPGRPDSVPRAETALCLELSLPGPGLFAAGGPDWCRRGFSAGPGPEAQRAGLGTETQRTGPLRLAEQPGVSSCVRASGQRPRYPRRSDCPAAQAGQCVSVRSVCYREQNKWSETLTDLDAALESNRRRTGAAATRSSASVCCGSGEARRCCPGHPGSAASDLREPGELAAGALPRETE